MQLVLSVDGEIITALASKNILLDHFCPRWFKTHFASCFPEKSLIAFVFSLRVGLIFRLWDKVLAISFNLEIVVALCILESQKREICSKSPSILKDYMYSVCCHYPTF